MLTVDSQFPELVIVCIRREKWIKQREIKLTDNEC